MATRLMAFFGGWPAILSFVVWISGYFQCGFNVFSAWFQGGFSVVSRLSVIVGCCERGCTGDLRRA